MSNPMVQQPAMSVGVGAESPITFPDNHEDPRMGMEDSGNAGGIWGFIKVSFCEVTCKKECVKEVLFNSNHLI